MAEQKLINTNQELSNFPNHVALVMDGNGRWAKARGLPRVQGHHRGAERLRDIVKSCPEFGIRFLTVFAFSTENWKRGEDEVSGLTNLFRQYMGSESRELIEKGVKINFIGNREAFDRSLVEQMNQLESATKNNKVLELTVAMNYGGKSEIVDMVRKITRKAVEGTLNPDQLDEVLIDKFLSTSNLPDPDLIIRTSGETRLSNFFLWQAAYSELAFDQTLWPDFTVEHFKSHLIQFGIKERRFGSIT